MRSRDGELAAGTNKLTRDSSVKEGLDYTHLLFIALEIGFRRSASPPDSDPIRHHDWIFKNTFSSDGDEVIADALSILIEGDCDISFDSFVDCFT